MLRNLFFLVLCTPLFLNAQTAFISGNDTICDNGSPANIRVDFLGSPPFTFVYSVNGVNQSSITTQNTPYLISTSIAGTYTLHNFNDAISVGTVSGSALVTVLESPTAIIHLASDTLSTTFPQANFISQSLGDIDSWDWSFGDNTSNVYTEYATHQYSDSSAIYLSALIIQDINGCFDTATKIVFVINNEDDESYWMNIPNSFTPDYDDGLNDKFCIEFNAILENTFLFKIYNLQGDLMYQTINEREIECCKPSFSCGWDGTHYKTSRKLPLGTYVYEMYYQELKGWKHKEFGTITLVR